LTDGRTNKDILTFLVPNENIHPSDYENLHEVPRPGHADYPASVKYPDYLSKSGGGMFSGRLTVLFCIIGAIAKQILNEKGIYVGSHIAQIGAIKDRAMDAVFISKKQIIDLEASFFPILDPEKETALKEAVLSARAQEDSVGGLIETAVVGVPVGLGEPLFHSVESVLSHLLFSVPAVKGVEFGDGFSFVKSQGSAVSDGYQYNAEGKIVTLANHNGGLLGGMTTGMPILVRTAIKPTSSIGSLQHSVNLQTKENVSLIVRGRHDPCIALRAVHVINAVVYYGILDLLLNPEPGKK
jgi:chorismate synthase